MVSCQHCKSFSERYRKLQDLPPQCRSASRVLCQGIPPLSAWLAGFPLSASRSHRRAVGTGPSRCRTIRPDGATRPLCFQSLGDAWRYLQHASTRHPSRFPILATYSAVSGPLGCSGKNPARKAAHRNMPCHVGKIRRCPDSVDCRLAVSPSYQNRPSRCSHKGQRKHLLPCPAWTASRPRSVSDVAEKKRMIASVSPVAYVRVRPGQRRECSIHRQTQSTHLWLDKRPR
jgi:hypothetical protein